MVKTLKIIAFILSVIYLILFMTKFIYHPILSEKVEGYAALFIIILALVIMVSDRRSKKNNG
ncbi:hypothetical protein ACY2DA_01170 [Staphylococcus simulans]